MELYNCGHKVLTMKLIKVDKLKAYVHVVLKETGTCFYLPVEQFYFYLQNKIIL